MSRIRLSALVVSAVFLASLPAAFAQSAGEIRALLENRTGEAQKAVGIVAGVIEGEGDGKGRTVIATGSVAPGGPAPNADTVFEIGSITKVFTSLLLADMAERGEVKLDDPVAKYLPPGVKVPASGDRQITLLDLSMQVSGLPRLPSNMKPANPLNPYADYSPGKLFDFLSGYQLTRAPGEKYEYSNLAVGLLGVALARRSGTSYEDLVRKRILQPLGMNHTSQTQSTTQGYNAELKPVPNWVLDAIAGAGALRSTVNDMLTFLAANLELTDSPLKPAMRRLRARHRATGAPEMEIAMGWHVFTKFGGEVWWHNGGTGGFRSFAGFDPVRKRAAVVLCNTSFGVDDVGAHLVDARYPAAKLPPPKPAVTLDAATLDAYAGEYELAPAFSLTVRRDGARLLTRATGQPEVELYAEKKDEFFLKVVPAQISFTRDGSGKVTGLVLHQNGRDQPAKKK